MSAQVFDSVNRNVSSAVAEAEISCARNVLWQFAVSEELHQHARHVHIKIEIQSLPALPGSHVPGPFQQFAGARHIAPGVVGLDVTPCHGTR